MVRVGVEEISSDVGRDVAQVLQNLESGGFSVWQLGHFMNKNLRRARKKNISKRLKSQTKAELPLFNLFGFLGLAALGED